MPPINPILEEHFLRPRNSQLLSSTNAVGFADVGGSPPRILVALRIVNEVLEEVSFSAVGCGYLLACGSACTELVKGLSVSAAERISVEEVEQYLAGLPVHRKYCAELAVRALRDAIARRTTEASSLD